MPIPARFSVGHIAEHDLPVYHKPLPDIKRLIYGDRALVLLLLVWYSGDDEISGTQYIKHSHIFCIFYGCFLSWHTN